MGKRNIVNMLSIIAILVTISGILIPISDEYIINVLDLSVSIESEIFLMTANGLANNISNPWGQKCC